MLLIPPDLLDKERSIIFHKLNIFAKEGVLAGGTALFLQIQHRYSYDFDIFFNRNIARDDLLQIKKIMKISKITLNTQRQLNITSENNIKVTLARYDIKPLYKTIPTGTIPLYDVRDIGLDKAYTIGRRAQWRDYIDLFYILKKEILNLDKTVELGQKKFGLEFNPKLFLEQLVYFNDLAIMPIRFIQEKYSTEEIQKFLKKQVLLYTKKKLNI